MCYSYAPPTQLPRDRLYITSKRYVNKRELEKRAFILTLFIIMALLGVVSPAYIAVNVLSAATELIK